MSSKKISQLTTGSLNPPLIAVTPVVSSSLNFNDDLESSSNGVPLGGLYRSGSIVMIRVT
jgi:hypothetical protein